MNDHPLWPAFAQFAKTKGLNLTVGEIWTDWWLCFLAGAAATRDYDAAQRSNPQRQKSVRA